MANRPLASPRKHSGCHSLNSVRVVTLPCVTRTRAPFTSSKRLVDCGRSILTRPTRPAPAAFPVPLTGAGFTPAGVGDGDLLDLNNRGNLSLNLRGVGDATGVGVGLGDGSAVVFLRIRLGVRDAAGDSAAEGDAPLSTGGVGSVVFSVRCLAGERDSVGVPVSSCD